MATKKNVNDTIDVTIYDTTYTLRGGSDPSAVLTLAEDLDARMKALASSAPAADPLRVAILCALRLSDEAREARESLQALQRDVSGRIEACSSRIDGLFAPEKSAAPSAAPPARSAAVRDEIGPARDHDGANGGPVRSSHA